jgi:hypothetical protein
MIGGGLKEKTKTVKKDQNGNKEVTTEETKVTGAKREDAKQETSSAKPDGPSAEADKKE